jgi:hypothetical protein
MKGYRKAKEGKLRASKKLGNGQGYEIKEGICL